RTRGSSRAQSRFVSAVRASPGYLPRSTRPGGRCAPWPHFRPAFRTRPSPWDEALRDPACAGSAQSRRPSCSCGRGPCGCAPTDRETSRGRKSWAWCWSYPPRSSAALPSAPASGGPPRSGRNARSSSRRLPPDSGSAKVAGPGEDDVFELLDRRGGHRRVDPGPILIDLAGSRDPERIGAQVLVEDRHGELDPLARRLRVGVPIGNDHAAARVSLKQGREGYGIDRRAPQIAVDPDRGDLRRCKLGWKIAVARAAWCREHQDDEGGSGGVQTGHRRSLAGGKSVQPRYRWSSPTRKHVPF